MSLSNTVENEVLDQIFGASDYAEPATYYIGLSLANPTDDASGLNEPSGGSYVRQAVDNDKTTWSTASGGALSNAIVIEFPTATADWGTITYVVIWDHVTNTAAVNLIGWGVLGREKAVDDGDTARFAIGEINITLD